PRPARCVGAEADPRSGVPGPEPGAELEAGRGVAGALIAPSVGRRLGRFKGSGELNGADYPSRRDVAERGLGQVLGGAEGQFDDSAHREHAHRVTRLDIYPSLATSSRARFGTAIEAGALLNRLEKCGGVRRPRWPAMRSSATSLVPPLAAFAIAARCGKLG